MSMANKIGNSKAMLEPVQLEKLTVTFVMNQRNMLQKNERKGTNIIRYFAYKVFTEMAPLPGAKQEGIIHSGLVKWCHAKFRKA